MTIQLRKIKMLTGRAVYKYNILKKPHSDPSAVSFSVCGAAVMDPILSAPPVSHCDSRESPEAPNVWLTDS